ncbi:regulation of response to stimulus [Branchiostoma belcheri]|nr:regulation of response to stimulus [Branchiostoma belcheri]
MTNITCLVYTWDKTYQHVFTAPLSSTPDDPVCVEKAQATKDPGSTFNGTRERIALTTRESNITTTKATLNQTSRMTTVCTCSPCPNGTVTKERAPHVAITIMGTAIGVVLVELLVAYVIRRQRCCSRGHLAGARGTAPNRCQQSSGDDQQYCEIPDEYYNQQNTVQSTTPRTDHHKYYNYHRNSRPGAQNPYWEIPDEYYSRYHTYTYPPTRRVPDKSYSVTINAAAAEVVLPSSTRRGGKHPSYDTAPQVRIRRDAQNHQIPAHQAHRERVGWGECSKCSSEARGGGREAETKATRAEGLTMNP